MTLLIFGIVLFSGVHLLRELGLRDRLANRLGSGTFKLLYAALAAVGIFLIVQGRIAAPFVMLYEPRFELQNISNFAMLPAFILVAAGNLPRSHIRHNLRHPMLLGTIVWAAAHLWANGDLASVLLFGGLGLWALIKFISLSRLAVSGSTTPRLYWDVAAFILGFILYGFIAYFHGELFGVGPRFI